MSSVGNYKALIPIPDTHTHSQIIKVKQSLQRVSEGAWEMGWLRVAEAQVCLPRPMLGGSHLSETPAPRDPSPVASKGTGIHVHAFTHIHIVIKELD